MADVEILKANNMVQEGATKVWIASRDIDISDEGDMVSFDVRRMHGTTDSGQVSDDGLCWEYDTGYASTNPSWADVRPVIIIDTDIG